MRQIQKEEAYAFDRIYNQLEKMDFSNFICSPLINGGCGLGKTTALIDPRMYELFARKLCKPEPHILVIESRSATRDQLKVKNVNLNYTFLQFSYASTINLALYDIIIIDEAHSLFSDSEFAPRTTAPLAEWLRRSQCFQIYITASDVEFIDFANKYFDNKEFQLTFPDLENAHVRYSAKEMFLSVSTKSVDKIIARKRYHFFEEKCKGLFFILSAKQAVNAYRTYSSLGYKCAFYVSQQNSTQIVEKESATEEDPEFFDEYANRTITIDVKDFSDLLEKQRKENGRETIREALLQGHFPPDVDYLFMTSTGQEGISLYDIQLDFVFIEDTYPLTINQKIFRYRNNVSEVFVHLPQRRIQNALKHTMEELHMLITADQSFLRGYYEGKKGTRKADLVWFNPNTQQYEVAKNYVAFILTKSEQFRKIRDNINNEKFMKETYGQYADIFHYLNDTEEEIKDLLLNFFRDKNGCILTEALKKDYLKQLKQLGLTNANYTKDFTFEYIINQCKKFNICLFKRHKANKKDVENNSDLIYRKEYSQIQLL